MTYVKKGLRSAGAADEQAEVDREIDDRHLTAAAESEHDGGRVNFVVKTDDPEFITWLVERGYEPRG